MSTALAATTVYPGAMPSQLRQMVNKWVKTDVMGRDPVTLAKMHVESAVEGLRGTGESAVMGSILGAFHAMNPSGLDVNVPGTKQKLPVDALGALVGLAGGIGATTAAGGMGKTVARAGFACAAVFGFRQTNDLIVKLREKKTGATQASNRVISKAEFAGEPSFGGVRKASGAFAGDRQPGFNGNSPIMRAALAL